MTVLVVSADPEFRALLTFLLSYHGFAVASAAPAPSPSAAAPQPTLVLLDLTSTAPIAATALLAASPGHSLPVLVLSWPEQLAQAQAQLPQAVALLPVPVVPRELLAAVRHVLAAGATPLPGATDAGCPVG